MKPALVTGLLLLVLAPVGALAQGFVPYDPVANFETYPSGVSTGGGFVDLDRDGDLDLVVANGNDISRQHVEVFYNDGHGNFPESPQWQSADIDYHGHLAIGDVTGDGWPDVAVSVFLGAGGFGSPGHVKLYVNDGKGQLSANPAWRSQDDFFTFSCALGDADGDGDLDLAVATGEPYFDPPDRNRVYYNDGGMLDVLPGWQSSASNHTLDVTFGDPDGDGDLDLAFCLAQGANEIYFQGPGGLATSPGWVSTDNGAQNGNTLAFHDLDGDGWLELGVSDNNQLGGGKGVFKIYPNLGGNLATTPSWQTTFGMTSAIAFADLHLDGYPDLAGGIWFAGGRILLNDGGTIHTSADWTSAAPSVVEAIFFGDVDGDGLRRSGGEVHPGDGVRRTFYLDHSPLQAVRSVTVDGATLGPASYGFSIEDGWIALDRAPLTSLVVDYDYSESLDMGITNWDNDRGSYVFRRHPLVDVTLEPPADLVLVPGDRLEFRVGLTSSTNRVESYNFGLALVRPNGDRRIIQLTSRTLPPFGHQVLDFGFTIPPDLAAFGDYEMLAGALEQGVIADRDRFTFSVVPAR